MKSHQVIVYAKDICVLLGVSVQHARRLLRQIKDVYNKQPHQYVSVREFAEYVGLPLEDVSRGLE